MRIFRAILILLGMISVSVYIIYAAVFCSTKMDEKVCGLLYVEIMDSLRYQFISSHDVAVIFNDGNLTPIGKNVSDINTDEMERVLKGNQAVRNVKCYVSPSGSVHVGIYQREPLFRVMGDEDYYIDKNGLKMPVFIRSSVYVPIVTGHVRAENLNELYKFVVFLQNEKFWNAQIEQIHILPNGLVELTPRVGNHQIMLGSFDGYERKLAKMKKFYEKGIRVIDWNRYERFDLRYENQIVGIKR